MEHVYGIAAILLLGRAVIVQGRIHRKLKCMEASMALDFGRILAAVTAVNGKADSLIELCNRIAQAIRDNVTDQAELNRLAGELETQAGEIQTALDANEPVPPTP